MNRVRNFFEKIVLRQKGAMKILIDSREQCPYRFMGRHYEGASVEVAALQSGDYSLAGLSDKCAIERKSLPDLVQCLGRERERFERELVRAHGLSFFAVVIEASWQELAGGQYQSRLNPHAACQSIAAFMARYRIPFLFAGTRTSAEYCVYSLLRQYLEGERKRLTAIIKAHEAA